MKNIRYIKIRIILLLFVLSSGIIYGVISFQRSIFLARTEKEVILNNLKSAQSWELDSITINNNWSITASTYDWCYGSGTWKDPYIIENVFIDGKGAGNCITIRNSNVFFIIRNCILNNSGPDYHYAGIYLSSANNGTIFNNTIYNNNDNGIYMYEFCSNNSIIGNRIENNINGISVRRSSNNILLNNVVMNNTYGIYLYLSSYLNNISSNSISNNQYGIFHESTFNDTISNNYIFNNSEMAIRLDGIRYLTLINNSITFNARGIYIDGQSNYNLIQMNDISNNLGYGIAFAQQYWYCEYNTITQNTINFNGGSGISVVHGRYNNFSYNTFKGNKGNGLSVTSDHNYFFYNNFFYNENSGLYLYSAYHDVIGNKACYNGIYGIYLRYSNYNNLERNNISYNVEHGIYLFGESYITTSSNYNLISQNMINKNGKSGIFLEYSDYNEITENILVGNYEGCINELGCVGNIIDSNICDDIYEDNDNFNEASIITEGLIENLHANDDDWYAIYVDANMTINVFIYFSSTQNLKFYFYNSSLYCIYYYEVSQISITISYTTMVSDYFYIQLSEGINIVYELAITITPKSEDNPTDRDPPLFIPFANIYLILLMLGLTSIVLIYNHSKAL